MFEGHILRWQSRIDAVVKSGAWAGVACLALTVALVFFSVAVFIKAQEDFGTIRTCLGFAGFFLAVALIAVIGLVTVRRNARRRADLIARSIAQTTPPWWSDPRLLATGLSLGKTLGGRRALSIGLIGLFVVGVLLGRGSDKRQEP